VAFAAPLNALRGAATKDDTVQGTTQVTWNGEAIDLGPTFSRWRMEEAVHG